MEYIRNIQLNTNCSACWLASKILQNIMICETAQEMDGSAKHAGKIIAEQKIISVTWICITGHTFQCC